MWSMAPWSELNGPFNIARYGARESHYNEVNVSDDILSRWSASEESCWCALIENEIIAFAPDPIRSSPKIRPEDALR